jgi:hypothetical protein
MVILTGEQSKENRPNQIALFSFNIQALGSRGRGGPGVVSNPRQQSIEMRKQGLEWNRNGVFIFFNIKKKLD